MEVLAISLLKTLASTCLKFYINSLLVVGSVQASRSELGYSIPRWYMNPGRNASAFHAYGTAAKGDEFQCIGDAQALAVEQMVTLIRRSHQRIISEEIKYDQSSIRQRRLVELFIRGDGLEDFVLNHAVLDRKQIVTVRRGEPHLRAFVRLTLDPGNYLTHQEATLRDLRIRLTHQKSEDIMEEMEGTILQMQVEGNMLPETPVPSASARATPASPVPSPEPVPSAAGSVFDSMSSELDELGN